MDAQNELLKPLNPLGVVLESTSNGALWNKANIQREESKALNQRNNFNYVFRGYNEGLIWCEKKKLIGSDRPLERYFEDLSNNRVH